MAYDGNASLCVGVSAVMFAVASLCAATANAQHRECALTTEQAGVYDPVLLDRQRAGAVDAGAHLPWGIPTGPADAGGEILLFQDDYVLNYDADLRVPTWAAYRLVRDDLTTTRERDACLRIDVRLPAYDASTSYDYSQSDYLAGRLVPRLDMQRSRASVIDTDLLSNASPQYPYFNRRIWRRLERYVRTWARVRGTIHIITGAIFDHDHDGHRDPDDSDIVRWMHPTELVAIPTAYFKILVFEEGGRLQSMAFLVPHVGSATFRGHVDGFLAAHLTSIDAIEALTGVDFFPDLIDEAESSLERTVAARMWPRH